MRPGLGRALRVDDFQCALEDVEIRLVENDEDVGVALVEVPFRLRLVVEAQDRRGRAAAENSAARLQAFGEAREPEGSALLGRREGMDAEAGLGDDAERPLAADEELGQVRTRRGPGSLALGVHDTTVGQHHFEADDHVLDLPVAGRVLPRPAAGQPAADGGEIHGLRPVPERVARADPAERRFQIRAESAGSHVRPEGGLVDLTETVELGHVEGHATVHGNGSAADTAPTGRRRDGHRSLVAGGEHG